MINIKKESVVVLHIVILTSLEVNMLEKEMNELKYSMAAEYLDFDADKEFEKILNSKILDLKNKYKELQNVDSEDLKKAISQNSLYHFTKILENIK